MRTALPAGLGVDQRGIFNRTISMEGARSGRSMLNIWINTARAGIFCEVWLC